MKILLVADADWVINQTRAAMTGEHELVEITDPREAEETMSDAEIVLIDMQVGSMGGMALTRSLKSLALGRGVRRRADRAVARQDRRRVFSPSVPGQMRGCSSRSVRRI